LLNSASIPVEAAEQGNEVGAQRFSLMIADGHPLIRRGLQDVVAAGDDYELVAETASGAECLASLLAARPDVALVDINITAPDALDVLKRAKASGVPTRMCLLADVPASPPVARTVNSFGAFIVDKRSPQQLQKLLSRIARELETSRSPAAADGAPSSSVANGLTRRHQQIIAMIRTGSSNRDIAEALGLSVGTVKIHLHRIYRVLNISNRTQLAIYAGRGDGAAPAVASPAGSLR